MALAWLYQRVPHRGLLIACGALMRASSLPAELETPEAFRGRADALEDLLGDRGIKE